MRVDEVMTTDVVGIGPDAPLKEAARRMIGADISGLVVTEEDGSLVGIISEADFVKTEAGRRAEKRARLLRWFFPEEEYTGSERKVRDVMTADVVTIGPDADHAEAARMMRKEGVKRLPVVDESGTVVGLVSRSDIMRVFARADGAILDEIQGHVMRKLWIDRNLVRVLCEDGNVTLSGNLETRSDADLLVELTQRLDGVVSVENRLTYTVDNTKVEMVSPVPGQRNW